jgi:hypothetical protein
LDCNVQEQKPRVTLMIRVTKSLEHGRICIAIDGQLSGDYIAAVEISCNQALSEGMPVDVFLHDVLTIDRSGLALLTRLAAKGMRLLATGVYTSYLVRNVLAAREKASARERRVKIHETRIPNEAARRWSRYPGRSTS